MGYISIQINKAKGSADTGASDHIERKTMPKNADPTRTHLNRELMQFPDGVADPKPLAILSWLKRHFICARILLKLACVMPK